jgi:hypothetical protein
VSFSSILHRTKAVIVIISGTGTGRKRAATSTNYNKGVCPNAGSFRIVTRSSVPVSESLDSIESWMKKQKRTRELKILARPKRAGFHHWPVVEVANFGDTVRKYDHLIRRTSY